MSRKLVHRQAILAFQVIAQIKFNPIMIVFGCFWGKPLLDN